MKAIVIGGGIGGTCAAIALKRFGIETGRWHYSERDQTGGRGDFHLAKRREMPELSRHEGRVAGAGRADALHGVQRISARPDHDAIQYGSVDSERRRTAVSGAARRVAVDACLILAVSTRCSRADDAEESCRAAPRPIFISSGSPTAIC